MRKKTRGSSPLSPFLPSVFSSSFLSLSPTHFILSAISQADFANWFIKSPLISHGFLHPLSWECVRKAIYKYMFTKCILRKHQLIMSLSHQGYIKGEMPLISRGIFMERSIQSHNLCSIHISTLMMTHVLYNDSKTIYTNFSSYLKEKTQIIQMFLL